MKAQAKLTVNARRAVTNFLQDTSHD